MTQRTTPQAIEGWASRAADHFLSGEAESATHGVAKVASADGLTPIQIHRTCERANHLIFARSCQKTAEPGRMLTFDLARPEAVIEMVQADRQADRQEADKYAHVSDVDYYLPPAQTAAAPPDLDALYAPFLEEGVGTPKVAAFHASQPPPEPPVPPDVRHHNIKVAAEHIDGALRELRGDLSDQESESQDREQKFYEEIRQRLLEGKSLEEVYRDLVTEPTEEGVPTPSDSSVLGLLQRVMKRLKAENLIDKEEDLPRATPPSHDVRAAGLDTKVASHHLTRALVAQWRAEVVKQAIYDLEEKRSGLRLPNAPSLSRMTKPRDVGRPMPSKPEPAKIPKARITTT